MSSTDRLAIDSSECSSSFSDPTADPQWKTSGTCASHSCLPITSQSDCDAAAASISYSDTESDLDTTSAGSRLSQDNLLSGLDSYDFVLFLIISQYLLFFVFFTSDRRLSRANLLSGLDFYNFLIFRMISYGIQLLHVSFGLLRLSARRAAQSPV